MRIRSVSIKAHGVDKLLSEDDNIRNVTKHGCNKNVEEVAANWNRKMIVAALAT